MNTTTTVWLSALSAGLAILGCALKVILAWVNKNKDTILALVDAIRDIKAKVDEHSATLKHNGIEPPVVSADDVHAQYTPSQLEASDAMSAARSRVGQVDPHDLGNAAIEAKTGAKP